MHGGIESHLIHAQLALRFGLMAVAGVSIFQALEDWATFVHARRNNDPSVKAPMFVGRGIMGLAILFFSPALLNRAMALQWDELAIELSTIVAMLLTLIFFLSMNVSRLVYYGSGKKDAVFRTLPVLLAAVILVIVGAFVNVQVG